MRHGGTVHKDPKYLVERRTVKVAGAGSIVASGAVACGLLYLGSKAGTIADHASPPEVATALRSLQGLLSGFAAIIALAVFLQLEGLRNFQRLIKRFEG